MKSRKEWVIAIETRKTAKAINGTELKVGRIAISAAANRFI